ncbi:MAG: type II toxin-antitoxin system HicA family toxin [Verrucomicrobia bacterium]|nr:type II toxin-antitoxin system HicA family toxin [Verrucomicrobiota bacterium]
MPRLPRISGSECISVRERLGFVRLRQRGSQVVLRRGTRGCVVPPQRGLKAGTSAGVLRQAGIDPEEFITVWKG